MKRTSTEPKFRRTDVELALTRPNPVTGEQEVYDTIGLVAVDFPNPEMATAAEVAEAALIVEENSRKLKAQRERKYREWYERGETPDDPGYNEWLKRSYLP